MVGRMQRAKAATVRHIADEHVGKLAQARILSSSSRVMIVQLFGL
jgi:hypothetical protein